MKGRLQELIADFRYGKYNWLEQPPTLRVSTRQRSLTIDPFYHGDKMRTDGDCLELSVAAANRIRNELPGANVFYCFGNEIQYSPRLDVDNHTFLAVFPEGREPPFEEYNVSEWLHVVDKAGALLVDPALRFVSRFPGSGYIVRNTVHDVAEPSAGPHTSPANQFLLLGRSPNGSIITFGAIFEDAFSLKFCISPPNESVRFAASYTELRNVVRKNRQLLALVETIHDSPVQYDAESTTVPLSLE